MALTQNRKTLLQNIFILAHTPQDDQEYWVSLLENGPEDAALDVITLFGLYPAEINWLTQIQKRKEQALKDRNHSLWQEIIDEEKKHLSNIFGVEN